MIIIIIIGVKIMDIINVILSNSNGIQAVYSFTVYKAAENKFKSIIRDYGIKTNYIDDYIIEGFIDLGCDVLSIYHSQILK